jgi:hypothetical protein
MTWIKILQSKSNFAKKFVYLVLFVVCLLPQRIAAGVPSGSTTDVPIEDKKLLPYKYVPVDPDYWQDVEDKLTDNNNIKVIQKGLSLSEEFGADTDDAIEGLLATGIALKNMKLYYASTLILTDVIKKKISSEMAQKALFELGQIDQEALIDPQDVIDDLLNSNEFGELHPDVQSFVSYYTGMSDLINGFRDWAKKESDNVKENSFWGQKTIYLKGLSEVAQNKLDEAEARFSRLSQAETTSNYFKKRSLLQIARISFERKDYTKANQIYHDLREFPPREKGRILLERAWSLFYLRNYSEALGLLQALKSPVYMVSATPERYILEMLIYKELCYYDKVSEVAKEYYEVFGQSLKNIKKRRDLKKDTALAHMALTNMRLQEQANFIDMLRDEVRTVEDINLKDYAYFKDIIKKYQDKDKEVQQRLYLKMESILPQAAEEVIDSEEQVKFLDYTAKLDALRIARPGEDRNYKAEKMSYVKFDKVFWPVENEFWIDELDDYRVLIKSQCDDAMPSSSDDENIIKQFGKEFQ